MNDIDHEARIAIVDAHTLAVAGLIPFPVEVGADMDGTFALPIDLGRRGDPDDPPDTADSPAVEHPPTSPNTSVADVPAQTTTESDTHEE